MSNTTYWIAFVVATIVGSFFGEWLGHVTGLQPIEMVTYESPLMIPCVGGPLNGQTRERDKCLWFSSFGERFTGQDGKDYFAEYKYHDGRFVFVRTFKAEPTRDAPDERIET